MKWRTAQGGAVLLVLAVASVAIASPRSAAEQQASRELGELGATLEHQEIDQHDLERYRAFEYSEALKHYESIKGTEVLKLREPKKLDAFQGSGRYRGLDTRDSGARARFVDRPPDTLTRRELIEAAAQDYYRNLETADDIETYLQYLNALHDVGEKQPLDRDQYVGGSDGTAPATNAPDPDALVGGTDGTGSGGSTPANAGGSVDGSPETGLGAERGPDRSEENASNVNSDADYSSAEVAWNGYVRIRRPSDGLFDICSGVLVHPKFVLTSAHCTDDIDVVADNPAVVEIGPSVSSATAFEVRGCRIADRAFNKSVFKGLAPNETTPIDCGFALRNPPRTRWQAFRAYPKHDLAVLELKDPVPGDTARPRPLLIAASKYDAIWTHRARMFGYGYVLAPTGEGAKKHDCAGIEPDAGLVLTDKRQQQFGEWLSPNIDARLRLQALLAGPVGDAVVTGAVCGDSGGAVTLPAKSLFEREAVLGTISVGNDPEGVAVITATFSQSAAVFLRKALPDLKQVTVSLDGVDYQLLCHEQSDDDCENFGTD